MNYDLVVDYLYELQIFMQLYYPYNFRVDKIYVMVDGLYYQLSMPQREFEYKEKHIEKTVKEDLLAAFITYSIKAHYAPKYRLSDGQTENYAQEII